MLKQMLKSAMVLALLSGCATKVGSEVQVTKPATNPCQFIQLTQYSKGYETKLYAELQQAGPDAAWPVAIKDYKLLRNAVKACKGS